MKDVKVDIDGEKPAPAQEKSLKSKIGLQKWKSFPNSGNNSYGGGTPRTKKWARDIYSDILHIDGSPLPKLPEEQEAVGIITMEDVIEELLQVHRSDFDLFHHYTTSLKMLLGGGGWEGGEGK